MTRNTLCFLLLMTCAVAASAKGGADQGAAYAGWRVLDAGADQSAAEERPGTNIGFGFGYGYARSQSRARELRGYLNESDAEFNDPPLRALLTVALRMPRRLHGTQAMLASNGGDGAPALALAAKHFSGTWTYSVAAMVEGDESERREDGARLSGALTLQAEHRFSAGLTAFASFSRIRGIREGEHGLFRIGMARSFGD
ncbi:hypothetical protein [Massilia glaciei]|uniref:Outer membrane protein beta-barrel domain-containing protein n=1 Tax=Massilia glaciei TaxID=1524097 RepID=A0A2U2I6S0_9BURK|nr:hypothetical protein [Massilia glaciei]PWF55464.1 hypothetical protein C7C56_001805 [Massilia glaciei]